MAKNDRTDVQTYDKLPRGEKQRIDLDRRAAVKAAESTPKRRVGDVVSDAAALSPSAPRFSGGAQAGYTASRNKAISDAKGRAEYKDLKSGPTKLFRVPAGTGMSVDKQASLGEFKRDESTRHYKGSSNVGKK